MGLILIFLLHFLNRNCSRLDSSISQQDDNASNEPQAHKPSETAQEIVNHSIMRQPQQSHRSDGGHPPPLRRQRLLGSEGMQLGLQDCQVHLVACALGNVEQCKEQSENKRQSVKHFPVRTQDTGSCTSGLCPPWELYQCLVSSLGAVPVEAVVCP